MTVNLLSHIHNIMYIVLMVRARLRAVNSSAIQISIQSTKNGTNRCRLNDGPFFHVSILPTCWLPNVILYIK